MGRQRKPGCHQLAELPERSRFDLQFNLLVDPEAQIGPRELEWEFSFIRNNDRATVHPAPFTFEISPESLSTRLDEDILSENSVPHEPERMTVNSHTPVIERKTTSSGDKTRVEISVSHLESGGFVKLSEQIPSGCFCEVLDAAGGIPELDGDDLNVLWFDYAPTGPVVYQLDNCQLSSTQKFEGTLSCVIDDAPKEFNVIGLSEGAESQQDSLDVIEKLGDITFEIQVAATKNPVVTDYFEQKLNFRRQTREERTPLWVKYTCESFVRYDVARQARNELTEAFAFKGPFVVARKGDRRISVQEALTLSNQVWTP